jgi:hypothetical protein
MKQKIKNVFYCALLMATYSNLPDLHAQGPKSENAEVRAFVQTFYNNYAAKMRKGTSPSYDNPNFSKELVRQLKEDELASSKAKEEIVGLDFDPVLATNAEPAEKYLVEKATAHGDSLWVDVYGVYSGKKTEKPIVQPELHKINQKWMITNFHYEKSKIPTNDDLLSVLKQLRQDRQKYSK